MDNLIQQMTPEQRILIEQFYAYFDSRPSGSNRKISNVEPLYYDGLIAGSEFVTYAATKMYICFSLYASVLAANIEGAAPGYVNTYDQTNTIELSLHNNVGFFNVSEKFIINTVQHFNDDFSCFLVSVYTYCKFIGYRITLV